MISGRPWNRTGTRRTGTAGTEPHRTEPPPEPWKPNTKKGSFIDLCLLPPPPPCFSASPPLRRHGVTCAGLCLAPRATAPPSPECLEPCLQQFCLQPPCRLHLPLPPTPRSIRRSPRPAGKDAAKLKLKGLTGFNGFWNLITVSLQLGA